MPYHPWNTARFLSFITLFISAHPDLVAQKKIFQEKSIFMRYYEKLEFKDQWIIHIEIEDRRNEFPDRQDQWVLPRIHLNKGLGNGWETGIGFGYFTQNFPQDVATRISTAVRPELRPFEEVDFKPAGGKLRMSNRYRLEERFTGKMAKGLNIPGYNFNYRFRYQLQLEYPVIKKTDAEKGFYIRAFDEIFFNFGKGIVRNTFDQNRYFIGFNYSFSKRSDLEIGYMNWFQERSDGTDYLNRNLIRITYFQNLVLFR